MDKWADMVLFGSFETHVDVNRPKDAKGKAYGGTSRIIHASPSVTWAAKNRHGLPDEIECGDEAVTAWTNFKKCLTQS